MEEDLEEDLKEDLEEDLKEDLEVDLNRITSSWYYSWYFILILYSMIIGKHEITSKVQVRKYFHFHDMMKSKDNKSHISYLVLINTW